MRNRLLFIIVAALIVIAAVVVILAYTYLDIGLAPKSGGALRVALQSFSAETLDPHSTTTKVSSTTVTCMINWQEQIPKADSTQASVCSAGGR